MNPNADYWLFNVLPASGQQLRASIQHDTGRTFRQVAKDGLSFDPKFASALSSHGKNTVHEDSTLAGVSNHLN